MLPKIIIAIAILSTGYFGYIQYSAKTYISKDTIIQGDYNPNPNKTLIFKNNSTLTVEGNANFKNPIECQNSSINIHVKGNLSVLNKLECENTDKTSTKGIEGVGIALAVEGNVEFSDNSSITSNGHILLVDNPDHLPKNQEDLEKLFLETGMDTNDGNFRIGPFGTDEENKPSPINIDQVIKDSGIKLPAKKSSFNLVNPVLASDPGDVILKGKWNINTPPKGINHILIFLNFPGRSLEINGEMTTPNGRDADDIKGGCYIDVLSNDKKYADNDALRMRARSGRLVIGNFKLTLGDGGKGGDAETDECEETAFALAGTGGQSGNMKLTAINEIIVKDSFTIIPGKGGRGGDAIAKGKKGENGNPGKQGGSALAIGGQGADNIKSLKSLGKVLGLDKIYVGSVIGGDGGDATAIPGDGGDGNICDGLGGASGEAASYGGEGGHYKLTLPPGVKDTNDADDRAGEKGKEIVNQGKKGKDGPPCDGDGKDTTSTPAPKKTDTSTNTKGLTTRLNFIPSGTDKAASANRVEFITNQYTPPYTFDLKIDGNIVWQGTISESDCSQGQEFTSCVLSGYKYNTEWNNHAFDLNVYNAVGKRLAGYNRKSSGSTWRPSCSGSNCPPPFIQAPLP